MNNNGNGSFYQTANGSTSTLRPRNNLSRLISYEDSSNQDDTVATSTSTSSTPPRFDSRSASPSASGTRARSKGKSQTSQLRDNETGTRYGSTNQDRRVSTGLWDQWSSISGLASSFLGSDQTNGAVRRASSVNKPKSGRMQQDRTYGLKQAQSEWGPKTESTPKVASIEEQRALLQAKRRELLLLQSNQAAAGRDSLGRYKRKDSDASIGAARIDSTIDSDVLVYRHKVQPHDTMAGVVIKYGCQPEIFRKVNRFWPNDNVQRKDYIVLPVDACSVRGKKTEAPYVADLVVETGSVIHQQTQNSSARSSSAANEPVEGTEPFPLADTTPSSLDTDSPYVHDSWVSLPSHPQPVEILRISQRALGYFPPGRRKSQSTSSTPFSDSGASTPKTSFDTLRHPPTHAAQQAQLSQQLQASLSAIHSPMRPTSLPRHLSSSSRSRSSSTVSVSNSSSQNAFLSALSGPGGVGTLRGLRSERAKPGPGDDALNKKVAQYAPDFLPQDHPDYKPSGNESLRPPQSRRTSNSLRATPRASIDSIRSTRSNSSTVPAAIAGWMGKVTSSPMRKKEGRPNMDLTLSVLGEGRSVAMDDLIELADTPDEVSRQLHDAVEERTPTAAMPAIGIGDALADQELMDERFPIRGRVRRAYEAD